MKRKVFVRTTNVAVKFCAMAIVLLAFAMANGPALASSGIGDVRIHLDSRSAIYKAGEKIQVQLTLSSSTGRAYAIYNAAPYGLTRLEIFDEHGQLVPSHGAWGYRDSPSVINIRPGEPKLLQFQLPDGGGKISPWADIKFWGYTLTRPGTYTIVAVASFDGYDYTNRKAGPDFSASSEDRSNVVQIRIVP
jgi:hypothetical protein